MHDKGEEPTITEDEAALYDRQIRLWGLDAQRRLRGARVLLIGLGGLGAEVAKNIVLAGIKSITLLDHTNVKKEDFTSQFFLDRADLEKNRAESSKARVQLLNPMVDVSADTENVTTKDEAFFTKFDVVCATCCDMDELVRINEICHKNNVQFFAGDIFGFYGYMFADLNEHEYAEEVPATTKTAESSDGGEKGDGEPAAKKGKTDPADTVTVKKQQSFTRLKEALELDLSGKSIKRTPNTLFIMHILLKFRNAHGRDPDPASLAEDKKQLNELKDSVLDKLGVTNKEAVPSDFANFCFAELSPVCAVVGGILGQEVIKAVSQKDHPHNNFFFYNGVEGSGMVDCIKK